MTRILLTQLSCKPSRDVEVRGEYYIGSCLNNG